MVIWVWLLVLNAFFAAINLIADSNINHFIGYANLIGCGFAISQVLEKWVNGD